MATAPGVPNTSWYVGTVIVYNSTLGTYGAEALNLSVASDGGSAITQWDVNYSSASDFSSDNNSAADAAAPFDPNMIGLLSNVPYYVRVRAVNAIGAGPWSDVKIFTPPSPAMVRANGTYKQSDAYVRVGGVWKKALRYVKVAGVWKL